MVEKVVVLLWSIKKSRSKTSNKRILEDVTNDDNNEVVSVPINAGTYRPDKISLVQYITLKLNGVQGGQVSPRQEHSTPLNIETTSEKLSKQLLEPQQRKSPSSQNDGEEILSLSIEDYKFSRENWLVLRGSMSI